MNVKSSKNIVLNKKYSLTTVSLLMASSSGVWGEVRQERMGQAWLLGKGLMQGLAVQSFAVGFVVTLSRGLMGPPGMRARWQRSPFGTNPSYPWPFWKVGYMLDLLVDLLLVLILVLFPLPSPELVAESFYPF